MVFAAQLNACSYSEGPQIYRIHFFMRNLYQSLITVVGFTPPHKQNMQIGDRRNCRIMWFVFSLKALHPGPKNTTSEIDGTFV